MSRTRTRAPTFRSRRGPRTAPTCLGRIHSLGMRHKASEVGKSGRQMSGLASACFVNSDTLHLIHLHLISNEPNVSYDARGTHSGPPARRYTCPMSASTPCTTAIHRGVATTCRRWSSLACLVGRRGTGLFSGIKDLTGCQLDSPRFAPSNRCRNQIEHCSRLRRYL